MSCALITHITSKFRRGRVRNGANVIAFVQVSCRVEGVHPRTDCPVCHLVCVPDWPLLQTTPPTPSLLPTREMSKRALIAAFTPRAKKPKKPKPAAELRAPICAACLCPLCAEKNKDKKLSASCSDAARQRQVQPSASSRRAPWVNLHVPRVPTDRRGQGGLH